LPLLDLRDVHAGYGEAHVLRGVSLSVEEGELVVVSGATGAGKTTLLRVVSGTAKATGAVIFEDDQLFRRSPEATARRGIAHIPEGRGTLDDLSVLENLQVGAWTQRGTSTRDLARVFEFFPVLFDRRDLRAGALAPAEQQMLGIGRAVMSKPRLLLVDEPTRGLPSLVAREILDVLRRLSEDGTTVLVVERNAPLALAVAGRGLLLDGGRVTLDAAADDAARHASIRTSELGF
jgi:branched-chain amino acid transport system ATP-binding protein